MSGAALGASAARFAAVASSCCCVRARWGSVSCAAFHAGSAACARPADTIRPITRAIVRTTERLGAFMADLLATRGFVLSNRCTSRAQLPQGIPEFRDRLGALSRGLGFGGDGADSRTCLGDPHALHEERI